MAVDKTLASRIPFEEIQDLKSWQLPNLGKNARVIPSVKKDEKKRDGRTADKSAGGRQASSEIIEDLTGSPPPLTAEQLKNLTETAEREAREEGYKLGYEEGMRQGEKKGTELGEQKAYRETKARLTEKSETFAQLADALFQPVTSHSAELENTLLTMAVELARHFIHSELSLNPALMFATVEQAVAGLPAGAKNIRVLVNTDDLPHIEAEFASKKGLWQFVGDHRIGRGGCKVESQLSSVDFSFERRIQDWRKSLGAAAELSLPSAPIDDYRPSDQTATSCDAPQEDSPPAPPTPEADANDMER